MLVTIFKVLTVLAFCDALTMEQIKQMGKTLRYICQSKIDVESEKIDLLNDGVFLEEKSLMCYMECIMKLANSLKDGKLNYEVTVKQVDQLLPDDIKDSAKEALTVCRYVSNNDTCQAAFQITKCIYNQNKSIFYFP